MLTTSELMQKLDSWGNDNQLYRNTYVSFEPEMLGIIKCFFIEEVTHKPGTWDIWWTKNHMRFKGHTTNLEMRKCHEVMYNFLTSLARKSLFVTTMIDEEKPVKVRLRQKKA